MRSMLSRTAAVVVALSMAATFSACTKKNSTAESGGSGSAAGGTIKVAFVP
jgi:uncharacterized lipoprotein YehR (DUF1307 family)